MTTTGLLRGPVKKDRPAPTARSVERRTITGSVLGTVALEPTIFGIEPNMAVLHQVVTAQLAAKRSGTQSTRTRAEVRGGGAKPYRQKGTGHARQGSTRAPHFVGGGVTFAPKPRSYAQRTPKKMVRLALHSALSDRASESKVALIDSFGWDEPKTREVVSMLDALDLDGTVLIVLSRTDGVAHRAMRNLSRVTTVDAGELNARDVLAHDWVLFTDATLPTADASDRSDDDAEEVAATSATDAPPAAATAATPQAAAEDDAVTDDAATDDAATDDAVTDDAVTDDESEA
jgi:large subunit ribosomal protein L4